MPVAPPHGSKLVTNCAIAAFTPMVASAKKAPRRRRMPSPNSSASALTATPPTSAAETSVPVSVVHEIEADVAAEPEKDDVAEIDVAGVADHQIEIAREDDVDGGQQQAFAQLARCR